MSDTLERTPVGDIVAADFRAANVLDEYGVDFCCGGPRSLADACQTAGADLGAVRRALEALPTPPAEGDADVRQWSVDRLIDHVVMTHHAYLRAAMPAIAHHLATLVNVHSGRHPELTRTASVFDDLRHELQQHMLKEEHVLFPYIRELAARTDGRPYVSPFGTIENPIRMMEREHRDAGDGLRLIRELTHAFTPPADGCTTYRACFAELADFERDLRRHIHLEESVLFPKALALEQDAGTAGTTF